MTVAIYIVTAIPSMHSVLFIYNNYVAHYSIDFPHVYFNIVSSLIEARLLSYL